MTQRNRPPRDPNSKYRILSMDGGPSVQTYVRYLEVIAEERPDFLSKVDMLTGSSDGAFAALWLATRPNRKEAFSPANARDTIRGLKEFMVRVFETAKPGLCGYVSFFSGTGVLDELKRSIPMMEEQYGGLTLGDLDIDACIPSYCIAHPEGQQPPGDGQVEVDKYSGADILCNFGLNDHSHVPALDAALMSGSFPILFPTHKAHADGGVGAQNPAMAALSQLDPAPEHKLIHHELGPSFESVPKRNTVILSLGSDQQKFPPAINRDVTAAERSSLGYLWWTLHPSSLLMLLSILVDGLNTSVTAQMRTLLASRYLRVAPPPTGGQVRQLIYYGLGRNKWIFRNAENAAKRWKEDPSSPDVHPNLDRTLAWIDKIWMPDELTKPSPSPSPV